MLAAVPCQGSDAVALVDLETYEPRGSVPVGGHPVHAVAERGRLFVATMDERAVSVVDADGSVRTITTGVLGPSHFARAAGRLFVSCTGGDAVAAIDPVALELVGRIHVGAEPHGIVAHDGLVYAGSRADGTISVFDPESLAVDATVEFDGGARIQDLDARDAVYAVDQAGARVGKLTPEGVCAVAPAGANPYEVTIDPDGAVYVPGRDDGTVHAYDPDLTNATVHDVGPGAADVEPLAGGRWVACAGEASLRSLDGASIDLPYPAYRLAAIDDARLVATHRADAAVSVVDVTNRRVEATVAVEESPVGVTVV